MGENEELSVFYKKSFNKFDELDSIWSEVDQYVQESLEYFETIIENKEKIKHYFEFFTKQLKPLIVKERNYCVFSKYKYFPLIEKEISFAKVSKSLDLKFFSKKQRFDINLYLGWGELGKERVISSIKGETKGELYHKSFQNKLGIVNFEEINLIPDEEDLKNSILDYMNKEFKR